MIYALGRDVFLEVHADRREVTTLYRDGVQAAQRPDTPENRAQAAEQGYRGGEAVWRSLVHHEALHTLTARAIYGRESRVLRHECGVEPATYAERLHEESVVLALQRWMNTRDVLPALGPYVGLAPSIVSELSRMELP